MKLGIFCVRSVFPVHGSHKKEALGKFILLFYNVKFKERQSITIHAELDLKQMALGFKKNLNWCSCINHMQTLTWCILDLATSIKAPLSAFWFEESLFVLLPDWASNKKKKRSVTNSHILNSVYRFFHKLFLSISYEEK